MFFTKTRNAAKSLFVVTATTCSILANTNSYKAIKCQEISEDASIPSLVQKADELIEEKKLKIQAPMLLEDLSEKLEREVAIHTHEGVRVMVSKGVNLGTQVSHTYMMGGPNPPMYQYRIVLVSDDRVFNASSDLDFNQVSLDAQGPLPAPSVLGCQSAGFKIEALAVNHANVHNLVMRGHAAWETSNAGLTISRQTSDGDKVALSYMQSISPHLALGGRIGVHLKSMEVDNVLAGSATFGDMFIGGVWDKQIRFCATRKVNPNRVKLGAELVVDEGRSSMGVQAEYSLKQSTVTLGVDSNLVLRSTVNTPLGGPQSGASLNFCGEADQINSAYKFGYSLSLNS